MSSDLENYKIQLQQVEAALIAEPDNKELLELKQNVEEIIRLHQEVMESEEPEEPAVEAPSSSYKSQSTKEVQWKVGDRCMAPTKNGQRFVAVIDGISQNNVAVTFTNNGMKHMVRLTDLKVAPAEERKTYVFQNKGKVGNQKEWLAEKERRKARAQKKEQRRKQLDEAGEKQKNKWQSFNNKAINKNFKGIKKVEQTRAAPDGGREAQAGRAAATVSSRKENKFGATSRGNMDALF